jgi:F-type H+-transporting ATPase subunit b
MMLVLWVFAPARSGAQDPTHSAEPSQSALPAEAESGAASHSEAASHGKAETHEGEEHAVPWYWNADLWKVINLLVIFGLAMWFGLGGIGPALRQRSSTIRTELDSARSALESAEKRFDDAEFRLARLHDEIEELRQEGRRLAQSDRERIIANAHAAAEEIGTKNRIQIGQLGEAAKLELRGYVAELVVGRVRQELQSKVERQGDAPFVHTILEQVEALPAAS